MPVIMGPVTGNEMRVISVNYTATEISPEHLPNDPTWKAFVVKKEEIESVEHLEPKKYTDQGLFFDIVSETLFHKYVPRERTREEQLTDMEEDNLNLKLTITDLYETILANGGKV
jgi:hypothetical protein